MGHIIVISGPGGVGKGTVVDELIRKDPQLVLSLSWTTRDRRPGEAADAYNFVTADEFCSHRDSGGFLEWNHFLGDKYYGSPVPDIDAQKDLVLEIDVNGARQIHESEHEALFVFIDTPSVELQRERLIGRGDPVEKVEERMQAGQDERELARSIPYLYVVNDDLQGCAGEIAGLIDDYRRLSAD